MVFCLDTEPNYFVGLTDLDADDSCSHRCNRRHLCPHQECSETLLFNLALNSFVLRLNFKFNTFTVRSVVNSKHVERLSQLLQSAFSPFCTQMEGKMTSFNGVFTGLRKNQPGSCCSSRMSPH